jgi:hypothetical protein
MDSSRQKRMQAATDSNLLSQIYAGTYLLCPRLNPRDAKLFQRGQLFGRSWDPAIFITVTALLVVVTLAASYVPADAATKVDATVALRYK